MARRRMLKSRFYGLVGAAAFAVGAAALIGTLVLTGRGQSTAKVDDEGPAPPDIRKALPSQTAQGAMAGRDLLVQMMDKEDPTRQAGELRAAVIDPLPVPGHYDVDRPQIWMFLKSGKTLYVRADEGQLVMPSRRQEPESGVLRGAVEIRIYDVHGVGGEAELGPPSIVAKMPFLTFDTTVPELESPQPFTVEGRGVRFEGKTLRVLASQTRERLELVEVLGGGTLTYTPPKEGGTSAGAMGRGEGRTFAAYGTGGRATSVAYEAQPGGGRPTRGANAPQLRADEPNIVNYLATFADDVTVTQAERVLKGDRLDVWARVIDGQLPDGAIGGSGGGAGGKEEEEEKAPETRAASEKAPSAGAAPVVRAEAGEGPQATSEEGAAEAPVVKKEVDESVRMVWSGPMVARPLSNEPRELEMNHVHLRVTAERRGVVTMEDQETGAAGRCAVLDYGATTQDLALTAGAASEATLWMPEQGRIVSMRIEQNLGSGIGHVPGPGRIEGLAEADEANRPLAKWADSATFIFAVEGERMTDEIREAILLGSVDASSQGSALKGESVHAYFTSDGGGSPVLTRVRAEGRVRTNDAKGNAMQAETLDVAFKPGTKEPEPSVATALGSVRVTSAAGDVVTAAFLEAELGRDEDGRLGARRVRAEEWVEVATAGGQRAVTPVLLADVPEQVIDLVGQGSWAAQRKDGMLTEVDGEAIRLLGKSNAIHVQSAGTFRHVPLAGPVGEGAAPARRIEATWTESMEFDDGAGTLVARGEVHAESTVPGVERQVLDADIVDGRLTPAAEHERLVREAAREGRPTPERALLFARARVDPSVAGGGAESRIQTVHYAQAASGDGSASSEGASPRIERLFQAQGETITADNESGIVEIPGAGRMVMADLRDENDNGARGGAGTTRGKSLFEWAGSMRYERAVGVVRLSDQTVMVQRRLDGSVLNVDADTLEARVRQAGEGAMTSAQDRFELTGVTARGSVVATERVGSPLELRREIHAEVLDYDTVRGVAEATAPSGGLVTLLETKRGTPVNARGIIWNLVEDRVEIRGMTTVTSPR